MSESNFPAALLTLNEMKVYFPSSRTWGEPQRFIRAVDGVSLSLREGETLGLVGESGCGKSTLARAVLGLAPVTAGSVHYRDQRIDQFSSRQMRPLRQEIQMIFQDPFASLNPRMSVGQIVTEPMSIFQLYSRRERRLEAMRLLDLVGLNPRYMNRYPHEFSGGQRQRIGIARALAVSPKIILCDEPVSALDVSIQAQVINLLQDLQQKIGLSYLFIAHDLAVVRHIADRVGVMYLGRIVESADTERLYNNPQHPYTRALLSSSPVPDPVAERQRAGIALPGEIPSPETEFSGCRFFGRCLIRKSSCQTHDPPLEGAEHRVACPLAGEEITEH